MRGMIWVKVGTLKDLFKVSAFSCRSFKSFNPKCPPFKDPFRFILYNATENPNIARHSSTLLSNDEFMRRDLFALVSNYD